MTFTIKHVSRFYKYITSGLPDKMSGECFFGETLRGKGFYGKNNDDKNKFSPKQILTCISNTDSWSIYLL